MPRRRSVRSDVLDWCQAILDETKNLVDDQVDRARGGPDRQWNAEVAELRDAVAELTGKVEAMDAAGPGRPPKSPSR